MNKNIFRALLMILIFTNSALSQSEFLESDMGFHFGLEAMETYQVLNRKAAVNIGFAKKYTESIVGVGVKVGVGMEDQDFFDYGTTATNIFEPYISVAILTNKSAFFSLKGVLSYYHADYGSENLDESLDSFESKTYKLGLSIYRSLSLSQSMTVTPELSAIFVEKKAGYNSNIGSYKMKKVDYKIGLALGFKVSSQNMIIITPALVFPKISSRNSGFSNEDNKRLDLNIDYILNLGK
ncbi:hypothetical protein F9K33_16135 [bacterium]|nr:MAG: hypothetical protein F9K33_16135 [bacterium]